MKKDPISQTGPLEGLPNVGPAAAADLRLLRIRQASDLKGRDPYALYAELNRLTGRQHDPCVIDVFISIVRFVEGAPALPWWHYTAERKAHLASLAPLAAGEQPE